MRKEFFQEIEIPEGVEVEIDGSTFKIKGPEGEVERTFKSGKLKMSKKDNKIILGNEKSTKVEKKLANTLTAHIKNMIKGVQEKFEYKLKVAFSHFPMTVEIQGKEATIKNFLGEKIPRKVSFPEGAEVAIDKDIITVKSPNKEIAGQAAANLEGATKIRMRDRRVFQDGIYIIDKAGREM